MVAGLQKPIFKARTSSTCRATTSATLSKTSRSSGFSQAKSASAVSYGIGAQRTTHGTGLIFNPSQYNSDYISQQRHALNDNRAGFYNERIPISNQVCSGSKMSTFEKIMAFNSIANQFLGTTAGIIDSFKKPQTKLSTTNSKMDGATTTTPELVTNMKNAKTSKGLDAAISSANNESTDLNSKIENAEGELKGLEGQTEGLESKYREASDAVRKNANAITNQDNALTALKSKRDTFIRQNLDNPNDDVLKQLNKQITDAENKLKELNNNANNLKQAEDDAKKALDDNKSQITEKRDKISEFKAQKQSIDNELGSQRKRLENLKTQERKTLTRLSNELTGLQTKHKTETSDDKKAQIVRDYQAKCQEYNNLLTNSSVTGFSTFPNFLE